MRVNKPKLAAVWHALDEAAFGADRTLNLRESLPSAAEARARVDVWLRSRQVTKAKEVLIITGRGNQSVGGIGVVRQEILRMLPSLRRCGVVESWKEHSPGSVVVQLAPMSALFEAPRRRRASASAVQPSPLDSTSLNGLQPETVVLLRQLAEQNIRSLGVAHSPLFTEKEMVRTFSALMAAIPETGDREKELRDAIARGIEETME